MEQTVVKVSDTRILYKGTAYYRCGNYFQRKGVRLHRKVWEDAHGKIPDGYHVHHKDNDRGNNGLDNLVLLQKAQHLSLHGSDASYLPRQRKHIENIRSLAIEWHKSEEGLEWHKQNGLKVWAKRNPREFECAFCGRSFYSKVFTQGNRFCCNNHKAAYRRLQENGKARCGEIYREI